MWRCASNTDDPEFTPEPFLRAISAILVSIDEKPLGADLSVAEAEPAPLFAARRSTTH
jgi:hypothetical protein